MVALEILLNDIMQLLVKHILDWEAATRTITTSNKRMKNPRLVKYRFALIFNRFVSYLGGKHLKTRF